MLEQLSDFVEPHWVISGELELEEITGNRHGESEVVKYPNAGFKACCNDVGVQAYCPFKGGGGGGGVGFVGGGGGWKVAIYGGRIWFTQSSHALKHNNPVFLGAHGVQVGILLHSSFYNASLVTV